MVYCRGSLAWNMAIYAGWHGRFQVGVKRTDHLPTPEVVVQRTLILPVGGDQARGQSAAVFIPNGSLVQPLLNLVASMRQVAPSAGHLPECFDERSG